MTQKPIYICSILLLNLTVFGCANNKQFQNQPITEQSKRLTIPKRFEQYGHNDDVAIILTFSGQDFHEAF